MLPATIMSSFAAIVTLPLTTEACVGHDTTAVVST